MLVLAEITREDRVNVELVPTCPAEASVLYSYSYPTTNRVIVQGKVAVLLPRSLLIVGPVINTLFVGAIDDTDRERHAAQLNALNRIVELDEAEEMAPRLTIAVNWTWTDNQSGQGFILVQHTNLCEIGVKEFQVGDVLSMDYFLGATDFFTMAGSRLFDDFAPTRDRSDGDASIFTYKAMAYETESTSRGRGSLDKYVATVFGEMDSIEGDNPAILRIKCPESLKCSYKAIYAQQVAALTEPLRSDDAEMGGVIGDCWLGNASGGGDAIQINLAADSNLEPNFARDFVKGQVVALWVSFKRVDREIDGEMHRAYSLESDFYTQVEVEPRDTKGRSYACDLENVERCDFC
ncbi:hypothetical protein DFH06DRAFT_1333927 [Mycena polygramma]|nr:hypothetical protein DFH06DRAFT_1333927 [Mycena polygramma]